MWSVRKWELWRLPVLLRTILLLHCLLAAVWVSTVMLRQVEPITTEHWVLFLLLAMAGVIGDSVAGRAGEATTRALGVGGAATGMRTMGVWCFAGSVLLPVPLVIALAGLLSLSDDLRTRYQRPAGSPHLPHRIVYNTSASIFMYSTGALVFQALAFEGPGGQVVAGLVAYLVMNTLNEAMLALVLMCARGAPYRYPLSMLWSTTTETMGLAALGFLLAVAWRADPLLILLGIPPVILLHQALLHQQLTEAASSDSKTGLTAAGRWREVGEAALSRVQSGGGSLGVLLVDLDHFKVVNDTYGHLAGDEVLIATADAMKRAVRKNDLVGRFGGEEFVVLLPDAGPEAVAEAAERIRRAVEEMRVTLEGRESPLSVTTSVGAATYPHDGYTLDELLEQADRALYAAKHGGRNRVCFPADAAAPDTIALPGHTSVTP